MPARKWNCVFLPAPPTREQREVRGFHARRRGKVGARAELGYEVGGIRREWEGLTDVDLNDPASREHYILPCKPWRIL